MTKRPGPKYLPGDPSPGEDIERMIRVDHAGEYGAVRIYAGQTAVLRHRAAAPVIREMAEQEQAHLRRFDKLIADRHVRPTVLAPLWAVKTKPVSTLTSFTSTKRTNTYRASTWLFKRQAT